GFGTWGSHLFVYDNCQQYGRPRLCISYLSKIASIQELLVSQLRLVMTEICINPCGADIRAEFFCRPRFYIEYDS
ncbi:Hypothetical predicted protein, partial [Olea europaea subsp. europaea]